MFLVSGLDYFEDDYEDSSSSSSSRSSSEAMEFLSGLFVRYAVARTSARRPRGPSARMPGPKANIKVKSHQSFPTRNRPLPRRTSSRPISSLEKPHSRPITPRGHHSGTQHKQESPLHHSKKKDAIAQDSRRRHKSKSPVRTSPKHADTTHSHAESRTPTKHKPIHNTEHMTPEQKQNKAASTIQSKFREFKKQKAAKQQQETEAASKIQGAFRKYRGKTALADKAKEESKAPTSKENPKDTSSAKPKSTEHAASSHDKTHHDPEHTKSHKSNDADSGGASNSGDDDDENKKPKSRWQRAKDEYKKFRNSRMFKASITVGKGAGKVMGGVVGAATLGGSAAAAASATTIRGGAIGSAAMNQPVSGAMNAVRNVGGSMSEGFSRVGSSIGPGFSSIGLSAPSFGTGSDAGGPSSTTINMGSGNDSNSPSWNDDDTAGDASSNGSEYPSDIEQDEDP